MAIAFDAKTGMVTGVSTTPNTTHTCAGTDRIVFVGISIRDTRSISVDASYDGVTMTRSGATSTTTGITNYLYYLINPNTTAGAVVTATQTASDNWAITVISYTGASQTGQPDATSVSGPSTATSYSHSTTSIADNCFAVLYGDNNSGSALTAGTNTTIRNQPEVAFTGAFLADSTAAQTPAGTFTLAFTSAAGTAATCMSVFKPAVAGGSTVYPRKALLGVGQ